MPSFAGDVWVAVAAVFGAVYAVLVLGLSRRREDFLRWRHTRFRLRIGTVDPQGEPLAIGSFDADGRLHSREVMVQDGVDNKIRVPPGQRLEIETVEGGERTSDGAFRVPANTRLWFLDAPIALEMPTDPDTGARLLPLRDEPYTLTTGAPPDLRFRSGAHARWSALRTIPVLVAIGLGVAADGVQASSTPYRLAWCVGLAVIAAATLAVARERARTPRPPAQAKRAEGEGSVILATLTEPLWIHSCRGAQKWLLGPKRPEPPHVLVVTMLGGGDDAPPGFNERIAGLCHLIAEAIETTTDLTAYGAATVVAGRERRYLPRFILEPRQELVGWLRNYPGRRVLIWGSADPRTIDRDGFKLRLRSTDPPDQPEDVIEGHVDQIVPAVLRWIGKHSGEGAAASTGLSSPVPPTDTYAWLDLLSQQERIALGKRKSQIIPPPEPHDARAWLDAALAHAAAHGAGWPQARLLAISMGMELHDRAMVSDEQRQRLLALVDVVSSEGGELARLVPAMLLGLGERGRAIEQAEGAIRDLGGTFRVAADEYGQWLAKIARPD